MDCECLPTCIFFNDRMLNMPSTAEIFKHRYCKDDFASCARYMVFKNLGRERVPPDLFPNQQDRAHDLLSHH